jgi:hypothetical protein
VLRLEFSWNLDCSLGLLLFPLSLLLLLLLHRAVNLMHRFHFHTTLDPNWLSFRSFDRQPLLKGCESLVPTNLSKDR